jgi:hypothetical protein
MNQQETEFLEDYRRLCLKHNMFINIFPKKARIEPNPNNKGNETNKEYAWYACFIRSLVNIKDNT